MCGGSSREFLRFGADRREDAMCPRCGALERHRFVWRYFETKTDLFDGRPKRVLHVAPERCFTPRLRRRLGLGYTTADLRDPRAMLRMDITRIELPDGSFDVVYCSHVLEHVPDDRAALRELHRVLRPGGWAILLVPITAERTIEDPSVLDPLARLKTFGQRDHVRRYGPDFVDRLREAGFAVKVERVRDCFEPGAAIRMGLTPASGDIHHCVKRGERRE